MHAMASVSLQDDSDENSESDADDATDPDANSESVPTTPPTVGPMPTLSDVQQHYSLQQSLVLLLLQHGTWSGCDARAHCPAAVWQSTLLLCQHTMKILSPHLQW